MTTHEEFKTWLIEAKRDNRISAETFRLGEILLRYIAVLEQVPNPTPAVRQAAALAREEFEAALAAGRKGASLPKNGEAG